MGPLSNSSAPVVLLKERSRLLGLSVLADHTAADWPLALAPVAMGDPEATPAAHLHGAIKQGIKHSDARSDVVLSHRATAWHCTLQGRHGHVGPPLSAGRTRR